MASKRVNVKAILADDDLRRLVIHAIVRFEFVGDRLAQLGDAARGGILGKSLFDGSLSSDLDVLGRVEVGFTSSEAANIDTFGLHRLGF